MYSNIAGNKHAYNSNVPGTLRILGVGGYFANSIFFFASGYCLTNVSRSFPEWYWRRFVRVYAPYLLALPFLYFAGELAGLNWINIVMPFEQYHFIPSILFLYVVYYFLSKLNQKMKVGYLYQVIVFSAIVLLYFFFLFDKSKSPIQHFSFIETVAYLIPMLLGGMAKEGRWIKRKSLSTVLVIVSFVIYVYQSFRPFSGYMKILQPCIGLFFAYGLGCYFLTIEERLHNSKTIDLIAAVSLESYIAQFISRKAFVNIGFPTNIIYHVICTIAVAYCLHYSADTLLLKMSAKNNK